MIRCPIINEDIDIGECVTIVDVCEECIKETVISDKIKKIDNWKEICEKCENHNN